MQCFDSLQTICMFELLSNQEWLHVFKPLYYGTRGSQFKGKQLSLTF